MRFEATWEADFNGISLDLVSALEKAAATSSMLSAPHLDPSSSPLSKKYAAAESVTDDESSERTDDGQNESDQEHEDEDHACPVCMEPLSDGPHLSLPCSHKFCSPCFKQWGAKHSTCPTCRAEITVASVEEMTGAAVASSSAAGLGSRENKGRSPTRRRRRLREREAREGEVGRGRGGPSGTCMIM